MNQQQLTDALCREAVRLHRILDADENHYHGSDTSTKNTVLTARLTWIGELIGLRMALCLIHGWDPQEQSDKEGKADQLITNWWERTYPAEWAPPMPSSTEINS